MGLISQVVSKGWFKVQFRAKSGVVQENQKEITQKVFHFVIQESEESGGLE